MPEKSCKWLPIIFGRIFLAIFICITLSLLAASQENKTTLDVNGFIMTDAGYNFNTIDPNWFDVMRPTKLPAAPGQFAPNGNVYFSLRQTRFGIKSSTPTSLGELKTQFDFDLFGMGASVGQTTFHLINAFGQLGKFLVGQTASVFMDQAVFPATLDYWGPMARVFIFNIQVRYMPIQQENKRLWFSIERPGASADAGNDVAPIPIGQVKPVFKMPNITAQYKQSGNWGHVQVAAVLKKMNWTDVSGSTTTDLSGSAVGWGWAASTVINASKKVTLKLQGVQGHGIESHIADAPPDVVLETNPGSATQPVKGIAQPVWGFFSFAEIKWNRFLESTIGYSQETVKNGNAQAMDAFRKGEYALVNLRWLPWQNILMGIEYQYGKRHNLDPGFHSVGNKLQFSFKFNFSGKTNL